ncbi:hypothetical protein [Mucilaginibacter sp. UYNi724]
MAIQINKNDLKRLSYIEPPGCRSEILLHPFIPKETIELALFQEHRFAFYYWNIWTNELNNEIPSLVTFDWHQDLCPPYSDELDELKSLDNTHKGELAIYTWAKISHQNDVQIKAALLLNKIKDVYAICRQKCSRPKQETVIDFYGNSHSIMTFDSLSEFEKHLPDISDQKVYFDIDLDYFTLSNPISVGGLQQKKQFTYLSKKETLRLLGLSNPVIEWVLKKVAGITIATEPEFCGGLKQSNYYLDIIDQLYFKPSLFHNIPNSGGTQWRHLLND